MGRTRDKRALTFMEHLPRVRRHARQAHISLTLNPQVILVRSVL